MDSQEFEWGAIKKWIVKNVSNYFKPLYLSSIDDVVDLYFKVIQAEIVDDYLSGIPLTHSTSLQRILIDGRDMPSHFLNIGVVEPFLRKIMYMVDRLEYNNQKENKTGLIRVISYLGLNDENINLDNPEVTLSKKNFLYHLSESYKMRNIDSHYCKELGAFEFPQLLISVLVVYLYTIDKHSSPITKWLSDNNVYLKLYINGIKSDFRKWNQRFVPIKGKEQFHEIALYAIEYKPQKNSSEEQLREGEIEQLRKDLISSKQNQMIILGEAGIGKTTTMMYLAYNDAESGKLPIYVELKLLTSGDTLENVMKRKVNRISDSFDNIMQSTNTCVFLDGLNEILPSIRSNIYREIIGLINRYPNSFFMISSRPQNYDGELGDIPSFILQKMDNIQIEEFLRKNTDSKETREIIINAINTNEEWLRILGTPLILFMLIRVVSIEKELPDDKNKIIIRFIKSLYNREKEKDFEFDRNNFHAILCHIAFECIDQIGNTNSGFTYNKAKQLLSGKVDIEDKTLIYILQKAVELNILVQDDNLYSFSHQSYQDTLAGDYFNTYLA